MPQRSSPARSLRLVRTAPVGKPAAARAALPRAALALFAFGFAPLGMACSGEPLGDEPSAAGADQSGGASGGGANGTGSGFGSGASGAGAGNGGGGGSTEPGSGGPSTGGNGAAGGADSGAGTPPGPDGSTPPPPVSAPTCGPAYVAPSLSLGTTYYFSACEAGAAAGCVAGNNANAGTSASAPKRDLTGFDVNALPAGTRLQFARGGVWTNFRVVLRNLNVTTASPLVIESYTPSWAPANAPRPLLRAQPTGVGTFEFGTYNDPNDDGGYVVRDLVVDGLGGAEWGFWLRDLVHDVTVDNVEITGFKIGVYSSERARFVTVRNSNIHHNSSMGWLGGGIDTLIEGNTIARNNFSGSGFEHGIYMGGSGARVRIRNNVFDRNSVVAGGQCTGGNLTVHGQYDGMLVEGNTIVQDNSAGGCYGISINPGYASAEWFRNFVVRGNTVVNLGYCAICMTSAPGAVVENNVVVNTQNTYQAGITIGAGNVGAGDEADTGAVVRNNTIFFSQAGSGSEGIGLRNAPGANLVLASNLVSFGAASAAAHCFAHPGAASMAAFENNLCHHAGSGGSFSSTYATQAAAAAAGVNLGGVSAAPQLSQTPAAANGYSCALAAASPAVNAGSATRSSSKDRSCATRATPDIGACER